MEMQMFKYLRKNRERSPEVDSIGMFGCKKK